MSKKQAKKRGRKPVEDPRTKRVVVLYNAEEFAKLGKLAKGYPVLSDFVRERTLA